MKIQDIQALEVFDSNGYPTVEVNLIYGNEFKRYRAKSIVPSNIKNERSATKELRDENKEHRGRGVSKAVTNINTFIAKALYNQKFKSVRDLDEYLIKLDGSTSKGKLGSNSLLGLSMAFLRAMAKSKGLKPFEYVSDLTKVQQKLPKPIVTLMSNTSDTFKSIEVVALNNDNTFTKNFKIVSEIYHLFNEKLNNIDLLLNLEERIFDVIRSVGKELGYEENREYGIILRVEQVNSAILEIINSNNLTGVIIDGEMVKESKEELQKHREAGNKLIIDGTVFNGSKVRKDANSGIVEMSSLGTITETLDMIVELHEDNMQVVIAHSDSDTEDTLLAHIAVGSGVEYIRFNQLLGSEVTSTVNELIRIEKYILDDSSICL